MKQVDKHMSSVKTYYVSDDNCFESESEDCVREYEEGVKKATYIKLYTLQNRDDDLEDYTIYECSDKYALAKAIADNLRFTLNFPDYSYIKAARNVYDSSRLHYAISVAPWVENGIQVKLIDEILSLLEEKVAAGEEELDLLKDDCEDLKNLTTW